MAAWGQPVCVLSDSSSPLSVERVDFPALSAYRLKPGRPTPGWLILPRPSFAQTPHSWCRNINLLPITYAFRPQLRDRLTLSGLTFPRKPWVFGEQVFHLFCRYSCQHTHFHSVHRSFRYGFNRLWNAPLPMCYHISRLR